jgi:hypothetical protein
MESAKKKMERYGALTRGVNGYGTHVGLYAERLLGGPLPWTRMRQAYALIALCDKYGDGRVEAICQSALAFDVVSVPKIAKMLKSAAKPARPEQGGGKLVQLPLPRFVRPREQFETRAAAAAAAAATPAPSTTSSKEDA